MNAPKIILEMGAINGEDSQNVNALRLSRDTLYSYGKISSDGKWCLITSEEEIVHVSGHKLNTKLV